MDAGAFVGLPSPTMTELNTRCLDTFPEWLRTLGADASALAEALSAPDLPEDARRYIAGGLNYLFKSLDLIPDGIEDLGFLDDVFVLRVSSALALALATQAGAAPPVLSRLAEGTKLISELLGKDYSRLEAYTRTLTKSSARGRSVEEILGNDEIRSTFLNEVTGWASSYEAPTFARDEKNLVKLQAFLNAKLPA